MRLTLDLASDTFAVALNPYDSTGALTKWTQLDTGLSTTNTTNPVAGIAIGHRVL